MPNYLVLSESLSIRMHELSLLFQGKNKSSILSNIAPPNIHLPPTPPTLQPSSQAARASDSTHSATSPHPPAPAPGVSAARGKTRRGRCPGEAGEAFKKRIKYSGRIWKNRPLISGMCFFGELICYRSKFPNKLSSNNSHEKNKTNSLIPLPPSPNTIKYRFFGKKTKKHAPLPQQVPPPSQSCEFLALGTSRCIGVSLAVERLSPADDARLGHEVTGRFFGGLGPFCLWPLLKTTPSAQEKKNTQKQTLEALETLRKCPRKRPPAWICLPEA